MLRYWNRSDMKKNLCYIVNIVTWKTVQYWKTNLSLLKKMLPYKKKSLRYCKKCLAIEKSFAVEKHLFAIEKKCCTIEQDPLLLKKNLFAIETLLI